MAMVTIAVIGCAALSDLAFSPSGSVRSPEPSRCHRANELACLYRDKRLPRPCQKFCGVRPWRHLQSFARVAPAVKKQVACASTEPGDSPELLQPGESSVVDEVFDLVDLLQENSCFHSTA